MSSLQLCNFLSGELQTAGDVTAGIVTIPESWLVFAILFRFVWEIPIKKKGLMRTEKVQYVYCI